MEIHRDVTVLTHGVHRVADWFLFGLVCVFFVPLVLEALNGVLLLLFGDSVGIPYSTFF